MHISALSVDDDAIGDRAEKPTRSALAPLRSGRNGRRNVIAGENPRLVPGADGIRTARTGGAVRSWPIRGTPK